MPLSEAYPHITLTERRKCILASLSQPLTSKQIARRTGLSFDACRDSVRTLATIGLLYCLNDRARRSRIYWHTPMGGAWRRRFSEAPPAFDLSSVDWSLYGWVCYSHRAVIIKVLNMPMQPSEIKRRARSTNPSLRMSANNVRDVIRLFVKRDVVRPVQVRRKAHPRYELTEMGRRFQQLLRDAEAP